MKQVGTLLLLILLPVWAFTQIRFVVEAKGLENDYILVEKPTNGEYIPSLPEKVLKGKLNRFVIESNDDVPGFMKIYLGAGRTVKVFLEPGKTSSLKVNLADFEKSLKFEGPQSSQNKFIRDLDRSPVYMGADEQFATKSFVNDDVKPKEYYLDVLDNIDAEKSILIRKGKKKFSSEFLTAMGKDITFYHVCKFSKMISQDYQASKNGNPSRFSSKWAYYWSKIFETQPLNDPANAVTEYFPLTLNYYIGDYRLGYQGEAMYEDPDLSIGEQFLEYDRLLWEEFKGAQLEYTLTSVLSQNALLGNNEAILFDLFQKFKNDFPTSRYLPHFEKAVAPIGELLVEEKFKFPEGVIQLDAEMEINSIEDIMVMLKGKVVYIDVWATWCSPCLFEFRQKKPLEDFVQGKDIALVFISVDNEDRREKWQNTIVDNGLKGYHIMANYSLRDELIDKFGDGSNLALPHYMIFNKNGKLADGNAKQPSHNTKLFNDLRRYID